MEFAGPHAALFADYVRYKRALGYAIPSSYQTVLRDMSRVLNEEIGRASCRERV